MLAEVMEKGCQLGPQGDKVIPQLSQIPFCGKEPVSADPQATPKPRQLE